MTNEYNDFVMKAVEEIAKTALASDYSWDALSVVADLSNGRKSTHGYLYNGEDCKGWCASSDFIFAMVKLRDTMAADEPRSWHQALIHITRSDMNFSIDFEYDDPTRWSVSVESLLSGEFPKSLRP